MVTIKREITKTQYDRAVENNGRIAPCDEDSVFSVAERYGYGVYLNRVYCENGVYYVVFDRGETCD